VNSHCGLASIAWAKEESVAAATVDQAVALIRAQFFDAAMLDMNLNGTSRAI
jgi:hypothetical protein